MICVIWEKVEKTCYYKKKECDHNFYVYETFRSNRKRFIYFTYSRFDVVFSTSARRIQSKQFVILMKTLLSTPSYIFHFTINTASGSIIHCTDGKRRHLIIRTYFHPLIFYVFTWNTRLLTYYGWHFSGWKWLILILIINVYDVYFFNCAPRHRIIIWNPYSAQFEWTYWFWRIKVI